jgi:uncharacterized protein YigE (DUF2233 family)
VLMICSGVLLAAINKIDGSGAVALITLGVGYLFGNGHGIIETRQVVEQRVDELARGGVIERRDDQGGH